MEEQLQQYLKEFVATLKEGGNFAMEQLPLFVKEYLTWGFWESIVMAIVWLSLSFLGFYLAKFTYKKLQENDPFDEFGYFIAIGFSSVFSILFLITAIIDILTAIQITVAPRVYLIENLTNLI